MYVTLLPERRVNKMKREMALGLMLILGMLCPTAHAGGIDVKTIMSNSGAALEHMRSGSRKMQITVKQGETITNQWVARRAHKQFSDGNRDLMVILEPADLKGTAYLFWKPVDQPLIQWIYFTPTRRVRKLSNRNSYDSFIATDFTYADLGIRDPHGAYRLLGEEEYGGKKVYKVETVPTEKWYYSKIISLIAKDNFLPVKREYYDPTGRNWKTKMFENLVVMTNVPIILRIRMLDHQHNQSTEIIYSEICSDVEYLSKEDFDPEKLNAAVFSPVCTVRPMPAK
jgi:hypothetical protein